MKITAVMAVRRVRKFPAPEDPNTVWLPPAAEGDAHAPAFAGLEQDDEDEEYADDDVKNGEEGMHGC